MRHRLIAFLGLTTLLSACVDAGDALEAGPGGASVHCPTSPALPTLATSDFGGDPWSASPQATSDPVGRVHLRPDLEASAVVTELLGRGRDAAKQHHEALPFDPSALDTDANAPQPGEPEDGPQAEVPEQPQGPVADPAFFTSLAPGFDPLQEVPEADVDLKLDNPLGDDAKLPAFANFASAGLQPGQALASFTLWNLEGKQVSLGQFEGKSAVLLISGSASCVMFRRYSLLALPMVAQVAAQAAQYTGKSLEILVVFTNEAHPAAAPSPYGGKQWTTEENVVDKVLVKPSTTFAHRILLARGLEARGGLVKARVLIDGMDDAVWQQLGAVPNAAHLIDAKGKLVWKQLWAIDDGAHDEGGEESEPLLFTKVAELLAQ